MCEGLCCLCLIKQETFGLSYQSLGRPMEVKRLVPLVLKSVNNSTVLVFKNK